jgi:transposase-like protein
MHDVEVKRKARQLYLDYQADDQVAEELKIPPSTVSRWRRKANGEWEKDAKEFSRNYAADRAKLKEFEFTWAINLVTMLEKVKDKVEASEQPDAQSLYAIRGILDSISKLKKNMDKTKIDDNDAVQALFDVMMADPEMAPLIKRKWKTLLEKATQQLKVN